MNGQRVGSDMVLWKPVRSFTSRLEAVYQSKLEAVEELRKSVLGKAFEGEI